MTLRDGDYLHDIVRYIELNLQKRYTTDQLRMMLMHRGYSRSAIEKGFKIVEQKQQMPIVEEPKKPKVVIIDGKDEPKEEEKPKGPGFFSKIFGFFNKPSKPSFSKDETVQVDLNGNLVR